MKNYRDVVMNSRLFRGIAESDADGMLSCLSARTRRYKKGARIMNAGDRTESLALVLEGEVHIVREDFWGDRDIVALVGAGQIFAESYACLSGARLTVDAVAASDCAVMYLNVSRVLTVCSSACGFHEKLIRNLVEVLAGKNLMLNEKLSHVTRRSTRGKLMSYLSEQAKKSGGAEFDIPFDRQQLADYLAVDRSAMSSELSKLRRKGVIRFGKNHFELLGGDW